LLCVMLCEGARPDRVRELVKAWYRTKAQVKLRERFDATRSKFGPLIAATPELLLRPMKLRWGGHTSSGRIILNYDLVRAPPPCIDYVVAHELAHTVHPNHGARRTQRHDRTSSSSGSFSRLSRVAGC
jgi:predicted metal-dependent hydrolase